MAAKKKVKKAAKKRAKKATKKPTGKRKRTTTTTSSKVVREEVLLNPQLRVRKGVMLGEPAWLVVRRDGHTMGYRRTKKDAEKLARRLERRDAHRGTGPIEVEIREIKRDLVGPFVVEGEGDENVYFQDGVGQDYFFKHGGSEAQRSAFFKAIGWPTVGVGGYEPNAAPGDTPPARPIRWAGWTDRTSPPEVSGDDKVYGSWEDGAAAEGEDQWYEVDYAGGSDYSGGPVTESNYQVLQELLEEHHPSGKKPAVWASTYGGHGTYGLLVVWDRLDPEVQKAINSLDDYPLLDEERHSQLEMEKEEEAWENWAQREFEGAVENLLGADEWPESVDSAELFELARDSANEYWAHESSGAYIDIGRIAQEAAAHIEADRDLAKAFAEATWEENPRRKRGGKKAPKMTQARRDFIAFLEGTLIPDLYESQQDSIAEDFEVLVAFMQGAKKSRGWTREQFMEFLRGTLIPDLRDSGATYTANDFARGLRYLERDVGRRRNPRRANGLNRDTRAALGAAIGGGVGGGYYGGLGGALGAAGGSLIGAHMAEVVGAVKGVGEGATKARRRELVSQTKEDVKELKKEAREVRAERAANRVQIRRKRR